jgi:hypothetical protein
VVSFKPQLLTCPFSFDVGKAPDNHHFELTDLQSDNGQREVHFMKFASFLDCDVIPNTVISETLERRCYQYLCSHRAVNKSDLRVQRTDEHLTAVLCIAIWTFTPNIGKRVSNCKHCHLSH